MWLSLELVLFAIVVASAAHTRFSNIHCEALDPTYCSFKKCEVKVLGRGIMGINIHAILHTGFFNNAKVSLELLQIEIATLSSLISGASELLA